jgi:hypothetical protein
MITVPQAGIVAGRSADIRIETPDIGGFVSQAAGAVAQKMGQIDQEQRAVRMSRAKIEMTKALGQEYQRISQLGDPAQIDAEWPQAEARIRDQFLNQKDERGRPVWRPDEADALGLHAMDLGSRQALALGERNITLHQSQQTADWLETRADLTTSAATADPVTMETLLKEGYARIDAQVAAGLMLPDKAVTEKQALEAEVMNARLITAIDQDPAATVAAIDAGTYNALGPEAVAQRRATAQAEVDRRAAAAATAAEVETKKRTDDIGNRLDTIGELTAAGRKVADVDFVLNAPDEVKANPKYPRALARVKLGQEIPNLDLMTPAQLDALIAAEKDREIVEDWEAERLPTLIEMRDRKATALATDPKGALAASGLPAPEIPQFDPSDTEGWSAALRESLSFDAFQRDKGYSDQSAIFTKEQKTELQAVLAPGADAAPKVALMTAILNGAGGNAGEVLTALEADPVSRRALKVLGTTQDPALTEGILRGQQKLDGKTVVPPSRKEQILAFDAMTGGAFDDAPAVKAEIMEAALALYADSAAGIDAETTASEGWIADGAAYDLYQQSVQRLLGAQPDRTGGLTVGGLQEVNGGLTVLPVGVSVAQIEDSWDAIGNRLAGGVWDTSRGQGEWVYAAPEGFDAPDAELKAEPTADVRLAPFKAASIYGGVPDLGANPSQMWDMVTPRRVGETDVYELVYEQNGRIFAVPEAGGNGAYRFRLKDLMRGARQ